METSRLSIATTMKAPICRQTFLRRTCKASTAVRGANMTARVATVEKASHLPPGTTYKQSAFERHWEAIRAEEAYWIDDIEGTIPSDFEGTFMRAGPGITNINGAKMHPFDGHGAIARIGVRGGKAHFAVKFVRTPAYIEEVLEKKTVTFRGFGTQKPGGMLANLGELRDKKVANTSVIEWGGKIYALWEGDRATLMDPVTLDTLGEEDLQGAVPPGQPFSAHPHFCSHTGHLVTWGSGSRSGNLWINEIDEKCQVKVSKTYTFPPLPPYLHDFIVTKNWYIFYQAPLDVDPVQMAKYLLGLDGQAKMASFAAHKPGKWTLLPRKRAGPAINIETPAQFVWHFANAAEDGQGRLVVDACTYNEFELGKFDMLDSKTIPQGLLYRHTIDPSKGTAERSLLTEWSGDFPRVNEMISGRPAKYVYMAAVGDAARTFPFQSIVKVDTASQRVDAWNAPDNHFVGEALFVPGAELRGKAAHQIAPEDEDKGYVVTLEYDGDKHRSDLVILDARNLAQGPIARLKLKAHLPFAFHNGFSGTPYLPAV